MAKAEQYGDVKRPGVLYGDNNWAILLDMEPSYIDENGMEMRRLLIIPLEHLLKNYPELQKPGALPIHTRFGDAIWVEYPTKFIHDDDTSMTNRVVRIDCGYDGRETAETRRGKRYTDEITLLQMEKENLLISNIQLTEENKILLGEKLAILKKYSEITNLIGKGEENEPTNYGESYPSPR